MKKELGTLDHEKAHVTLKVFGTPLALIEKSKIVK
jgi:hypothetical protein